MSPELQPSQASTTIATTEPRAPDTRTHLPAQHGEQQAGRWAAACVRVTGATPQGPGLREPCHNSASPLEPVRLLDSPHMLWLNWRLFTEA